jgi:glucokinase
LPLTYIQYIDNCYGENFMPDEIYLGAVDIGGTKVTASISNRKGFLTRVYQKTRKEGKNTALPEQIIFLLENASNRAGLSLKDIYGLGISSCSPFSFRDNFCYLKSANICGGLAKERGLIPNDWTEIPIDRELKPYFPRLEIENDCISAAIAERQFGAGRGEDNMAYVTWSTGIGAGAFVNGRLLTGKNRNAVHIGHTFISFDEENSPLCGCGDYGHLEAFSAGPAIARDYGLIAADTAVDTKQVFEKYSQGDPGAIKVIERVAKIFAKGLANLTILLDIKVLILGGSIINDWEILEPLVKKEFFKCFPPLTEGVEFRLSGLSKYLGDMAGLCLIMPDEWISLWQKTKPWEKELETIVL